MFLLEEEVAIVNYVSLEIKLVHEVACPLQCPLVQSAESCLLVVLARTHLLIHNLEYVNSGLTLYRFCRELAFCSSSNGTAECLLACAYRRNECR